MIYFDSRNYYRSGSTTRRPTVLKPRADASNGGHGRGIFVGPLWKQAIFRKPIAEVQTPERGEQIWLEPGTPDLKNVGAGSLRLHRKRPPSSWGNPRENELKKWTTFVEARRAGTFRADGGRAMGRARRFSEVSKKAPQSVSHAVSAPMNPPRRRT